MSKARDQFYRNVEALMVLDSIYQYLSNHVTAFDISEILRAQYVLTVSAMDYYVHEIVREGLLNAINTESTTTKLNKVSIPLQIVKVLFKSDNEVEKQKVLDASIRDTLAKNSYQSPLSIESALGLIGYRNLFSKICDGTDRNAKEVRDQLGLIILKRNKIAHEADINYMTREKELMDRTMTTSCREHLSWIVDQIDQLIES